MCVVLYLISTNRRRHQMKERPNKYAGVSRKPAKRPLPVGLSEEQHKYLEGQSIGKAEYMRNLLVVDMEKNK